MIVGEQSEIISKVKVVQLSPEGPLDAISLSIRRLPHHPVNGEEKQERRQKAPLTNAGLHVETMRQLAFMNNLTSHSLVRLLDDACQFDWDPIVSEELPQGVTMKTVKSLEEVYVQ